MKMFEGEYFVTVAYISLAPPSRSKAAKDSPTTATYQLVYQNVPEVDSNYITNELDKKYVSQLVQKFLYFEMSTESLSYCALR